MIFICLQVDRSSVKPPPAVEETYRGVAAPSRPKVNAAPEIIEMPRVNPSNHSVWYWYLSGRVHWAGSLAWR
jgi:hypothetical protein